MQGQVGVLPCSSSWPLLHIQCQFTLPPLLCWEVRNRSELELGQRAYLKDGPRCLCQGELLPSSFRHPVTQRFQILKEVAVRMLVPWLKKETAIIKISPLSTNQWWMSNSVIKGSGPLKGLYTAIRLKQFWPLFRTGLGPLKKPVTAYLKPNHS